MVDCCVNLNCFKTDPIFKDLLADGKSRVQLTDEMKINLKLVDDGKLTKTPNVTKVSANGTGKIRNQTLDSFIIKQKTPTSGGGTKDKEKEKEKEKKRERNKKRKRSAASSDVNLSISKTLSRIKTMTEDDDEELGYNLNLDEDTNNNDNSSIDVSMKQQTDEDEIQIVSPEHTNNSFSNRTEMKRCSKENLSFNNKNSSNKENIF